jgi:dihydrofolate synthase / folylpolyglutamate synthase
MTPRERLFALEQFGIKLGLDNITALVESLDRPDQAFPTLHIGGTNGKGSVTAMVERGLRAAGHRTGRYTSPHLTDIEERMAIDGVSIPREAFDQITADVMGVVDRLMNTAALDHPPTFFEVTTAIALEAFRRAEVSVGVIEVGLGGRFDATNVIRPVASAITSIAFDHERHLGTSLAQIAFEKAGIIKHGVPVVAGVMSEEAGRVIADTARSVGAPLTWAIPSVTGRPVELALNGAHQHANAAVAVEVLRVSADALPRVALTRDAIVAALTDVEWPARLEWLRLSDGDVLLDAAHNPAGAQALADYVLSSVGPLPLVCSIMRDKDVPAIARALAPGVSRFVATTAPTSRALPARELAEQIRRAVPDAAVEWQDNTDAAIRHSLAGTPRAMVAGSIFLVGPVRAGLLARGATPVRYSSKASPFYLD